MNLDHYGGRRFLLTVGAQLLNAWLLYAGKLSDGSYLAIVMATVGAYVASNTYQKREELRATSTPDAMGAPILKDKE